MDGNARADVAARVRRDGEGAVAAVAGGDRDRRPSASSLAGRGCQQWSGGQEASPLASMSADDGGGAGSRGPGRGEEA